MAVTTTVTNNPAGGIKVTKVASGETEVTFNNLLGVIGYNLIGTNIVPSSAGANLLLRCSSDNGSSYDSGSVYYWSSNKTIMTAAAANTPSGSAGTATSIHLIDALSTAGATALDVDFHGLGNTVFPAAVVRGMLNENGGSLYSITGGALYAPAVAVAVNAIQIFPSSGTISGTFTIEYIII